MQTPQPCNRETNISLDDEEMSDEEQLDEPANYNSPRVQQIQFVDDDEDVVYIAKRYATLNGFAEYNNIVGRNDRRRNV